jgi:hypothetical protein
LCVVAICGPSSPYKRAHFGTARSHNPYINYTMAAKDAVVNNEAVLAHYMEKLSSQDVHTYVTISDKLTLWLRSDRAYYAAVRPKVSPFCAPRLALMTQDVL